ncbi:hypothetical protein Lal_00049825, partial [Lupinus albus]
MVLLRLNFQFQRVSDPVTPFLFIMVAQGFAGLVRMARSVGIMEGFKMGKMDVEVINLQSVDDTMMIFKPTVANNFVTTTPIFLSYKIEVIPFLYLGIPVGPNPRSINIQKN